MHTMQSKSRAARVQKVAISHSATADISVSIDVMHHKIGGKNVCFLTILDIGDSMLKLGYIRDPSDITAYEVYLFRWIAYFDAPKYTIVDRGSNLNAK